MGTSLKRSFGFTIVELLIVIVVIGILAAITVVAYNGIQNRAKASSASSAATQAAKKIALYQADTSTYPLTGNLNTAGVSNDNGITYQYTSDGSSYCLTASVSGVSYNISNTSSVQAGACSGQVNGGSITNLVTNPSFTTDTVGWVGYNATIARVTTPWALDGASLQITPTAQDSMSYADVPAQAGKSYTVLGTSHIESPQTGTFQGSGQQRNIFFEFRNASGGYLGTGGGNTPPPANANGTYPQRGTGVAPAGTTTLRIRLYNGATTGGGVVYWDNIMAVEGSYSGGYGDGASPGWAWSGGSNNSTSNGPPL
jgi:prepilin-type N-terminal cleavage/methylation domain-containing protein